MSAHLCNFGVRFCGYLYVSSSSIYTGPVAFSVLSVPLPTVASCGTWLNENVIVVISSSRMVVDLVVVLEIIAVILFLL